MNPSGSNLPELHRAFATEVVLRLKEAGFEALWAGGCVRDLLRGQAPVDYDVATSALPEQVRTLFGHRRTLPVGASFGVIIVLGPTKQHGQIEVATFRTDATYSDGRHPDAVSFSTPEHDAMRRDFTINGMFYDPVHAETIDFVGGREDLRNRTIRAIGNADHRIAEDKLRMLRAIRFAARFEYDIDAATYSAICRHSGQIAVVSRERMATEMRKTLVTARAAWAVDRWSETGLLKVLMPEVAHAWSDHRQLTMAIIEQLRDCQWTVAMAGLLLPLTENLSQQQSNELVCTVGTNLRLANEETAEVAYILRSQADLHRADQLAWSLVQPTLADRRASLAVSLLEARAGAGLFPVHVYRWLRQKLSLPSEQLNPPPLVTGQDLIAAGLRPGPEFKKLIQHVRDLQLDGQLANSRDALDWISRVRDDH